MNLKGRLAVCDYCKHTVPSSSDLPFFRYNESNFRVPKELLNKFGKLLQEGWSKGYSGNHNPDDPHSFPKELQDRIEEARKEIEQARKYDSFYCGCKGWD